MKGWWLRRSSASWARCRINGADRRPRGRLLRWRDLRTDVAPAPIDTDRIDTDCVDARQFDPDRIDAGHVERDDCRHRLAPRDRCAVSANRR